MAIASPWHTGSVAFHSSIDSGLSKMENAYSAFQFRTLLPEGLLLYHGMADCKNFTICDYLAFELVDAHLMVCFGSSFDWSVSHSPSDGDQPGIGRHPIAGNSVPMGIRLLIASLSFPQASSTAMNDGQWHSVVMERSGRRGGFFL
jgi:hypothetical protein